MKWHVTVYLCLSIVLCACSKKHTQEIQTDIDLIKWERAHNKWHGYEILEDSIFMVPSAPLWGDSMTIPPLPPAPSFHYVWLSPSAPLTDLSRFPVYARRTVRRYAGDSIAQAQAQTEEHAKQVTKEKTPKLSHWWVYVLIFLFVDVIGLFVYFIWRLEKKAVPL